MDTNSWITDDLKFPKEFFREFSKLSNKYLNTTKLDENKKGWFPETIIGLNAFEKLMKLPLSKDFDNEVGYLFMNYMKNVYHENVDLNGFPDFKNTFIVSDKTLYNTQRNNKNRPSGSCNVTSQWIQFSSFKEFLEKGYTDDNLWERCNSQKMIDWVEYNISKDSKGWEWIKSMGFVSKKTLNEIYSILAKNGQDLLNEFNIKKIIRYDNLSLVALKERLKSSNKPIVFGARFIGGGHIVCAIGYFKNFLIVHDPWGDWNTGYKNHDGAFKLYDLNKLNNISSKGLFSALSII